MTRQRCQVNGKYYEYKSIKEKEMYMLGGTVCDQLASVAVEEAMALLTGKNITPEIWRMVLSDGRICPELLEKIRLMASPSIGKGKYFKRSQLQKTIEALTAVTADMSMTDAVKLLPTDCYNDLEVATWEEIVLDERICPEFRQQVALLLQAPLKCRCDLFPINVAEDDLLRLLSRVDFFRSNVRDNTDLIFRDEADVAFYLSRKDSEEFKQALQGFIEHMESLEWFEVLKCISVLMGYGVELNSCLLVLDRDFVTNVAAVDLLSLPRPEGVFRPSFLACADVPPMLKGVAQYWFMENRKKGTVEGALAALAHTGLGVDWEQNKARQRGANRVYERFVAAYKQMKPEAIVVGEGVPAPRPKKGVFVHEYAAMTLLVGDPNLPFHQRKKTLPMYEAIQLMAPFLEVLTEAQRLMPRKIIREKVMAFKTSGHPTAEFGTVVRDILQGVDPVMALNEIALAIELALLQDKDGNLAESYVAFVTVAVYTIDGLHNMSLSAPTVAFYAPLLKAFERSQEETHPSVAIAKGMIESCNRAIAFNVMAKVVYYPLEKESSFFCQNEWEKDLCCFPIAQYFVEALSTRYRVREPTPDEPYNPSPKKLKLRLTKQLKEIRTAALEENTPNLLDTCVAAVGEMAIPLNHLWKLHSGLVLQDKDGNWKVLVAGPVSQFCHPILSHPNTYRCLLYMVLPVYVTILPTKITIYFGNVSFNRRMMNVDSLLPQVKEFCALVPDFATMTGIVATSDAQVLALLVEQIVLARGLHGEEERAIVPANIATFFRWNAVDVAVDVLTHFQAILTVPMCGTLALFLDMDQKTLQQELKARLQMVLSFKAPSTLLKHVKCENASLSLMNEKLIGFVQQIEPVLREVPRLEAYANAATAICAAMTLLPKL